jgi:hypothetical protein
MCRTLSRTRSSRRLIGGGCTLVMCGRVNSTVRWGFEPAGTWFVPVESNPSKRCGDQLVQTTLRFFPTERRRAHRRFFPQLSRRPHHREELWPAPCQVQQTRHWRWLGILWQTAASMGIVSSACFFSSPFHHSRASTCTGRPRSEAIRRSEVLTGCPFVTRKAQRQAGEGVWLAVRG